MRLFYSAVSACPRMIRACRSRSAWACRDIASSRGLRDADVPDLDRLHCNSPRIGFLIQNPLQLVTQCLAVGNHLRKLMEREFPRLCPGGSRSLTVPGVLIFQASKVSIKSPPPNSPPPLPSPWGEGRGARARRMRRGVRGFSHARGRHVTRRIAIRPL
jgi:hypothetical protein